MATTKELLLQAEKSISASKTARLDAEIIFCEIMQLHRTRIYSHPEEIIPDDRVLLFQALMKQRQQGHPIAHLTGKKEFWSLELGINKDTLIPRPETELLVEMALQMIPKETKFNILELGTGSGAIAIAIATERPNCKIIASDMNMNALTMAKKNAKTHRLRNIQFYLSDWYQNIPLQLFDLLVSNPPYIKKNDKHLAQGDVRFESKLALLAGMDGLQAIHRILDHAKSYLASDAYLLIEHGCEQKTLVQEIFLKHGFKHVETFQDLSGQDRMTRGQSPD